MTKEIKELYTQIMMYYFAFMKGKLVVNESIARAWHAQQVQNEADKLTDCFMKAFPNAPLLAVELDPLVTRELCDWPLVKAAKKDSHYRFLERMIEVMNNKITEYHKEN